MRLLFYEQGYLYTLMESLRVVMGMTKITYKPIMHDLFGFNGCNYSVLNRIPFFKTEQGKEFIAYLHILDNFVKRRPKPEFGIKAIAINRKEYDVHEEIISSRNFCKLIHFKKKINFSQPKLLIVAPMSGHYATLLRGTVEDCLEHFDVYITDWQNARDVPISAGDFDLDDYIGYIMDFIAELGAGVNILAVCQPAVPVMAAMSLMSTDKSALLPNSVTLIGGPIDTRQKPTKVNMFAEHREMNWFEKNLITRVPINYPGFMRPVYPGFLQLAGFMSMNMQRHVMQHIKLFDYLVKGDGESVQKHRKFYDEYFTVMDIPAEFYLQTIETVFKRQDLPQGQMQVKSRKIDLTSITDLPILAIEGENDDITGLGQTKAIIKLCKNLSYHKKKYYLQKDVGHYGSFNGNKFKTEILPVIKEFVYKYN